MAEILIIEDDLDIATLIRLALERDGQHHVTVMPNGEQGLEYARAEKLDLVLLDLNLPGIHGLDVCRLLRAGAETAKLPIIMMTARAGEQASVEGLDSGADDYVVKPFSVKELVARVRAALRRAESSDPDRATTLSVGPIEIDVETRRVTIEGEQITLTRKEFDLLCALVKNGGRVLTRQRLLETVWGYDHAGATRTVDVHIRQLRRKVGETVARAIETVVGVGYRFNASAL